ncbi:MAG: hypothetical protein RL223_4249 [Pseudomonadota bacterium]|jgi:hypothetical protein
MPPTAPHFPHLRLSTSDRRMIDPTEVDTGLPLTWESSHNGTAATRSPRQAGAPHTVSSNNSRPISIRRISLVPAPIS